MKIHILVAGLLTIFHAVITLYWLTEPILHWKLILSIASSLSCLMYFYLTFLKSK